MFESKALEPESLAEADDKALVAAISGWARLEAAAAARRLAVIGELVARRTRGVDAVNRSRWSCDYWDAAAAEVAAAEQISHGMASSQMYLASALRDRLPKVAALFLDGAISTRLVATMVWRTTLITDPYVLHVIDTELAEIATGLGPLSAAKTAAAIDALIDRHDPEAIRRYQRGARGREVVVDTRNSENGTTALWGRLLSTDGAALDRRLTQLAHTVCDDDPRTLAQRRADALGALAAGADNLACACGNSDCPAAGADARATNVTVYVLADQAALNNPADPRFGAGAPDQNSEPAGAATTPAPQTRPAPSGHIIGGGTIPAPLLAHLVNNGATVKPLRHPTDLPAEPHYRPSTALAAFVRARDLTCRFPGCDQPATHCDIDHAVAHPRGATHPANLRCLCRKHHLLKTFWTGAHGWSDIQYPDGTVKWTSPTGHTYTTRPGSTLLFPALCQAAATPAVTPSPATSTADRGLMMPTRKRTRIQDRAHRINSERALNKAPP
ncbi:HNH endonuclease signature motif containing protein [Mycolicibacter heraklionensis]|nr:HNH endonuclease signature motif containing protein [Mycolicibacter heraklionensis]